MAATNQRNKSGARKGQAEKQSPAKHRESQAADTMEEMSEEASRYLSRGASQVREMTRDHEGSVVLVALAAGFGVGLLIGCAMAPSHKRRSWSDRIAAEGIGRRFLDRVESMIPDTITERFSR